MQSEGLRARKKCTRNGAGRECHPDASRHQVELRFQIIQPLGQDVAKPLGLDRFLHFLFGRPLESLAVFLNVNRVCPAQRVCGWAFDAFALYSLCDVSRTRINLPRLVAACID